MKPLAIWLAVVAVVFGGYALITSATRDTTQVFVVVDSSFQMRPVWTDVQLELDRIDDEDRHLRYLEKSCGSSSAAAAFS